MIYSVVAYKDYKAGLYANPFYTSYTLDQLYDEIVKTMRNAEQAERNLMIDLQAWYLGTYDNETGKHTLVEPVFIVDMNELINPGGSSDGKEENN